MGFLERDCTNLVSLTTFMSLLTIAILHVNGNICSYSNCTTNMYSSPHYYDYNTYFSPWNWEQDGILFPFRTPEQPQTCGLPGFDLGCNASIGKPVLSFPASNQSFTVESMFNASRLIELSDPQGCLPIKLLHLDSSGTAFRSYSGAFTRFSIYSCPSTVKPGDQPYQCGMISCAKEPSRNPFVCEDGYTGLAGYGCTWTRNVSVVGDWGTASRFSSADWVHLTWDMPPECVGCESMGMDCGRDPSDSARIKCFPPPSPYKYPTPSYHTKRNAGPITAILVAFFLPIVFVGVCVCYIRCIRTHDAGIPNNALVSHSRDATTATPPNITSVGLEQATLDSYPIFLVGNSGRILMTMEDKACPICLSDYEPADALKALPECLHKFHSDCIDEWLLGKGICPVCRTIPSRSS